MPIKSVLKALSLLDILGLEDITDQGRTLTELAETLGIPANTARTILKTMIDCGYVRQNQTAHYVLGDSCLRMSQLRQLAGGQIRQTYMDILESLNRELNELISLVTIANGKRVLLALFDSSHTVKINRATMETFSPYSEIAPSGRVLVAYAAASERKAVVTVFGYPGKLWDNATNEQELDIACQKLRRQGYAYLHLEKENVAALACPVLNKQGKILAAIGCGVPLCRCRDNSVKRILGKIQAAASEMAARESLPDVTALKTP